MTGQHQAPGPGVDEQAVGAADVRRPVGRSDLLGDQGVAGRLVRRAQQRLGQAHQRQPLRRREPELLQKTFDHALPPSQPPRLEHQGDGLGAHRPCVGAERLGLQQPRDGGRFVLVLAGVQRIPIEGRGEALGGGRHEPTARRRGRTAQAAQKNSHVRMPQPAIFKPLHSSVRGSSPPGRCPRTSKR